MTKAYLIVWSYDKSMFRLEGSECYIYQPVFLDKQKALDHKAKIIKDEFGSGTDSDREMQLNELIRLVELEIQE